MPAEPVTFLQASDLHLGGRAWPGCFSLSSQQQAIRQQELRASVTRLCALARNERVDLVLLPGDLFDSDAVSDELVNFLIQELEGIAPTPVFIAPGNHDYLGPGSVYLQETRRKRGVPLWGEHVHVFTRPTFESIEIPQLPGVSVTASADTRSLVPGQSPLANSIAAARADISFLLYHGSRLTVTVNDTPQTNPFTPERLLAQGFSYTALGHYHTYSEIRDAAGQIRAAYGGRPFGAEMSSAGEDAGCCLIGTADAQGVRELRRVPLDTRRVFDLQESFVDVATQEAALAAIRAAFDAAGVSAEDFVRLRLRGTHAPGIALTFSLPEDLAFCAQVDTRDLRPGYDLDALRDAAESSTPSVEALFVRAMQERIEQADPENAPALTDALYYGLDALHGVSMEVRDAD